MFKNGKPLSTELLLHALSCFWIEMGNLIKMWKMSIVDVELKYSNTGSEQLFYMEKCLIHHSGFPGHCDL